ncbi:MAG: Fic family protein, partial [Acidimicrobiales bacterium]
MKIPESPPSPGDVVSDLANDPERLRRLLVVPVGPVDPRGRYLHWDDMRSRTPPGGLSRAEWWFTTSRARNALARPLPLLTVDGSAFRFCNVDEIQEAVHQIDQKASGEIAADEVVTDLRRSNRYLVSSLIEEAITSSQLEGASTTRRVAKDMLETGRPPRDNSERMIVNNYRAMLAVQTMVDQPLAPDDVLGIHQLLVEDTLANPDAAGRMQTPDDKRIGVYWHDNTLLHQPPPAEQLPARMEAMCRFANGETPDGFLHPVTRAIILHFWVGYDHPFEDGNGRTARALFYWCMLHNGYWLVQYLSVSSILRRAPAQYARSYLRTETDSNDTTYFVLYQLDVI